MAFDKQKNELARDGFCVIDNIFSSAEIQQILKAIASANSTKSTFRKTDDLFAIRQFLKEVPETAALIFSTKLKSVINDFFGDQHFVSKSIYFDKPERSNWFVGYHQDLTISVDRKVAVNGFGPWTVKQNQFAVQPPLDFLQDNFTIRIHLDETDQGNGALKVIPGSHTKDIYRPETIDWNVETEATCNVRKGGIMIMRPLLLHSSGKTTNNAKRRVIHIEFATQELPAGLQWAEYFNYLEG